MEHRSRPPDAPLGIEVVLVKILLHAAASADLAEAGDWYEARRPGLAAELVVEIGRALEILAENPLTWPIWPGMPANRNIRRFLLRRFPFALPYQVESDRAIVLAVAHVKRRPGYWLERARQTRTREAAMADKAGEETVAVSAGSHESAPAGRRARATSEPPSGSRACGITCRSSANAR
jgi:toxin ParE1/3/4